MQKGTYGNASKEYADQRLRDSPYRQLKKSCTHQVQNPLIVQEKESQEGQDGSNRETD